MFVGVADVHGVHVTRNFGVLQKGNGVGLGHPGRHRFDHLVPTRHPVRYPHRVGVGQGTGLVSQGGQGVLPGHPQIACAQDQQTQQHKSAGDTHHFAAQGTKKRKHGEEPSVLRRCQERPFSPSNMAILLRNIMCFVISK